MASVQNVNNNTAVNTSVGVGAGAAVGTGLGYLLTRKPSEDAFVKAGLKLAENEVVQPAKFLTKTLKQVMKDGADKAAENISKLPENVTKRLGEILGKDTKLNIENIQLELRKFSIAKNIFNKGAKFEAAIKRLENFTHQGAKVAIANLKNKKEEAELGYSIVTLALKDSFKKQGGYFNNVVKYMKKGATIKYAAIGAAVLGALGFILANKSEDKKAA